MHVVEILLPLRDNDGATFPDALLRQVRAELTHRFGGVTAFERSPAKGIWREPDGDVASDDIITVEVMAQALDRTWWRRYRAELERRFRQDEIVIRATSVERL